MPTVIFPAFVARQWPVNTTIAVLKSFLYLLHKSSSIYLLVIGVIYTLIYTFYKM